MTFSLTVDGIEYAFGGVDDVRAILARFKADPGNYAVLSGCRRCRVVCAGVGRRDPLSCTCCRNYGSNHGGGKVFYPDDGKSHERLLTRDELFAWARAQRKAS